MLVNDGTGKYLLTFENVAVIRRIPMERRGTSKRGLQWTLGSALFEVFGEEGESGSAQLYLVTFDEEVIEQLNVFGVGKRVKIRWHVESREKFDSYAVSAILDGIEMLTDGENFIVGKGENER